MIPNITQNDIFWEGSIDLLKWNEFFNTKLDLMLNIGGDSIIEEVNQVHRAGYDYILENQEKLIQEIFSLVYNQYDLWQEEYGYEEDEIKEVMPNISNIEELKPLMKPQKIFILNVSLDGIPYIGIQLSCTWDEEHGVGVMFLKDRVVKIGGSDTAFMTWIAQEDKNRQ